MNKWQMDDGFIERWPDRGGVAYCSKKQRHESIHPDGRSDEYRYKNRRDRYKPRLHGATPVQMEIAANKAAKGKGKK